MQTIERSQTPHLLARKAEEAHRCFSRAIVAGWWADYRAVGPVPSGTLNSYKLEAGKEHIKCEQTNFNL